MGDTESEAGAWMAARLLLAVLLLWGTTEAVVCRAYCAHVAEIASAAEVQPREHPAPDAAPCHGHGRPSPAAPASGSKPRGSDGSDDAACCPDLWLTAGAEAPGASSQAPAFSAQGTFLALAPALESGRRMLANTLPPEPLPSPFRTRNSPLLS
jgi:hypothetical protein